MGRRLQRLNKLLEAASAGASHPLVWGDWHSPSDRPYPRSEATEAGWRLVRWREGTAPDSPDVRYFLIQYDLSPEAEPFEHTGPEIYELAVYAGHYDVTHRYGTYGEMVRAAERHASGHLDLFAGSDAVPGPSGISFARKPVSIPRPPVPGPRAKPSPLSPGTASGKGSGRIAWGGWGPVPADDFYGLFLDPEYRRARTGRVPGAEDPIHYVIAEVDEPPLSYELYVYEYGGPEYIGEYESEHGARQAAEEDALERR